MSMLIIATAFVERQQRMIHVPLAAEQAQFLAREGQKQNSALLFGLFREPPRQLDHARRAGSVVVRAGMDVPDLRRRERVLIAQTQMIVMRADDHVLVGVARKVGGHVVHGLHFVPNIDGQIDLELGKRERMRRHGHC